MAWLLRRGDVLASVELPGRGAAPARSASGRGTRLLEDARLTHTFGRRGATDVAYLDAELAVVETAQLGRNRLALPRRGARSLLVADAGAFERWGLRPGDQLEIKE